MQSQEISIATLDILRAVRDGLGRYVLKQYKQRYSRNGYLVELQRTLGLSVTYRDEEQARKDLDLQAWLRAIQSQWDELFSSKLGHKAHKADKNISIANARNYLYEIQNARNIFVAHEKSGTSISYEDVYSLADTAFRILMVVKAKEEAAKIEEIKLEFGRKLYSSAAEEGNPEPQIEQATITDNDEPVSEVQPAEDDEDNAQVRVDLSGLDLSGIVGNGRNLHLADLQGANLEGSKLQNVRLADRDLSYTKLSKSDLTSADLSGSNLIHAEMSDAKLIMANLTKSNLSRAKLVRANLRYAKFIDADFSHADLTGVDISNPKHIDFVDDDLGWQSFDIEILSWDILDNDELFDCMQTFAPHKANFSYAILRGANLQQTYLGYDVNFTKADLTRANFFGSRIGASFVGAILDAAIVTNCHLLDCDFSGAKMQGVDFSKSEFMRPIFANADMPGANLEAIHAEVADDLTYEEGQSWDNVNLAKANLRSAHLSKVSFRNANLAKACFEGANLSDADLSNTNLNETDFTEADLTGADFSGAQFFPLSTILPDGKYWTEDTDMTRFTGEDDA